LFAPPKATLLQGLDADGGDHRELTVRRAPITGPGSAAHDSRPTFGISRDSTGRRPVTVITSGCGTPVMPISTTFGGCARRRSGNEFIEAGQEREKPSVAKPGQCSRRKLLRSVTRRRTSMFGGRLRVGHQDHDAHGDDRAAANLGGPKWNGAEMPTQPAATTQEKCEQTHRPAISVPITIETSTAV